MELNTHVRIPDKMFFTISDVAEIADVKPYVLRYWESQFPLLAPDKGKTGRRQYGRKDVENVLLIKHLLYDRKYSIEGAKRHLSELRKQGELKNARQLKVTLTKEQIQRIEAAQADLRALLALCK